LGDESPAILEFVDNVGLCERGEPLTIQPKVKTLADIKPPPKTKEPPASMASTTQPVTKQQPVSKQKDTLQARHNEKQGKSRVPPPKLKMKKDPPSTTQPANKAAASDPKPQLVMVEKNPVHKTRPTRGKATSVCGCFGAIHAPLTNCLLCGRISCTKEGYGFCAFCGYMVEEVKDGV
jgi:antitoxin (DNA-binding transcriptional repressor) of toxin-antitoxin stability system